MGHPLALALPDETCWRCPTWHTVMTVTCSLLIAESSVRLRCTNHLTCHKFLYLLVTGQLECLLLLGPVHPPLL